MSTYVYLLVVLLILALYVTVGEAKTLRNEDEKEKKHHAAAAHAHSKHSAKSAVNSNSEKKGEVQELTAQAAPVVTPLEARPAIIGNDLPAPLDMKTEGGGKGKIFETTVDNLHTPEDATEKKKPKSLVQRAEDWIDTQKEKAAAILELKKQPKLVAMVDGVNHERATPLFSDFPTYSPTPKVTGPLPFLHTPTLQPTLLQDCDPTHPPCKKFIAGICSMYYHCDEFVNGTLNDDALTYEPTHMPVPNPTPAPSEAPTSVPSTSAPTYRGYTPMPTISFMPTVAETAGPTSAQLCNPMDPPCDHYFFDICLGKRHCYGSHPPTPSPTASKDAPTAMPVHEGPTMKPSMGPTDFAHELAHELYVKGQNEKAQGEKLMAKWKAEEEMKKSGSEEVSSEEPVKEEEKKKEEVKKTNKHKSNKD